MLRFLLAFLFLMTTIMAAGCSHLFYFPDSVHYRDPKDYPFPVESLEIPRDHQTPIHAWLMNPSGASKGLVLHFHGNAQNLTAHADFTAWLAQAGYTVLIFDYSGYGETKGKANQQQLIEDSYAVWKWVRDKWQRNGLPLIVFAQSLGGAVATTSLGEHPDFASEVDLLILESTFDSYHEVAFAKLRSSPVTWIVSPSAFWLVSEYRDPRKAVKQLIMPKIFVHGNADGVVPFASGKALYEAAPAPKEFWEIPFGNHTEAFVPGSPYRQQLLDRLKDVEHQKLIP